MPKYRGYSLTPGSPAERRFSTTRYLFHYSQLCILSRDKFNSFFLRARSHTRAQCTALVLRQQPGSWCIPRSLGSRCPRRDPSLPWPSPSSSQQLPAAPTQPPGKALQTAPSLHSREELHQKAGAYACNYRCK